LTLTRTRYAVLKEPRGLGYVVWWRRSRTPSRLNSVPGSDRESPSTSALPPDPRGTWRSLPMADAHRRAE